MREFSWVFARLAAFSFGSAESLSSFQFFPLAVGALLLGLLIATSSSVGDKVRFLFIRLFLSGRPVTQLLSLLKCASPVASIRDSSPRWPPFFFHGYVAFFPPTFFPFPPRCFSAFRRPLFCVNRSPSFGLALPPHPPFVVFFRACIAQARDQFFRFFHEERRLSLLFRPPRSRLFFFPNSRSPSFFLFPPLTELASLAAVKNFLFLQWVTSFSTLFPPTTSPPFPSSPPPPTLSSY